MDDLEEVPIFGERVAGQQYVVRPSVYALLQNAHGRLAIVETPQGWFLPGGGVERGETERQAVVREAREESGLAMRPGACIGRAVQFVYSITEKAFFEKICAFFAGEWEDSLSAAVEADHQLRWLPPDDAERLLSHESHRWAVSRWRQSQRPPALL